MFRLIFLSLISVIILTIFFLFSENLTNVNAARCFDRDLTGKWMGDNGETYYIIQNGNDVWWFGSDVLNENAYFSNVFQGQRNGEVISGEWVDVPLGETKSSGEISLECSNISNYYDILSIISSTGGFGDSDLKKRIHGGSGLSGKAVTSK